MGNRSQTKIYWNPENDTISISGLDPLEAGGIFDPNFSFGVPYQQISQHLEGQFKSIRFLEIKDMWWFPDEGNKLRQRDDNSDPDLRFWHSGLFFGHFPNLEQVKLITREGDEGCGALLNREYQEDCLDTLDHFFKRKAEDIPGFKVPKFTLEVLPLSERGMEDPDYEDDL